MSQNIWHYNAISSRFHDQFFSFSIFAFQKNKQTNQRKPSLRKTISKKPSPENISNQKHLKKPTKNLQKTYQKPTKNLQKPTKILQKPTKILQKPTKILQKPTKNLKKPFKKNPSRPLEPKRSRMLVLSDLFDAHGDGLQCLRSRWKIDTVCFTNVFRSVLDVLDDFRGFLDLF